MSVDVFLVKKDYAISSERKCGWLLAVLLLLSFTGTVVGQERLFRIGKDTFQESFSDNVEVSGGIRAGVMYASSAPRVDFETLFVHFSTPLAEAGKQLCVSMVSLDGRYSASWRHPIPEGSTGSYRITLPSQYHAKLENLGPDDLVVLAAVADACPARDMSYIPASWGTPAKNSLKIFLNAGTSQSRAIFQDQNQKRKVTCNVLPVTAKIAYDTVCVLMLSDSQLPSLVQIVRTNFPTRLPTVRIPLE